MTSADPTRPRTRKFDSPEQAAFLNLWRTYDRLRALEEELFARFDLTAQQYNVLRLLQAAAPELVPTQAIAGKLISRAPDVTRMLDKLEQRGLIRRDRPAYDRRTVLVGVTEAGLGLIDRIAGPLQDCHSRQLGHMTRKDLRSLVSLLQAAREPHEPEGGSWR